MSFQVNLEGCLWVICLVLANLRMHFLDMAGKIRNAWNSLVPKLHKLNDVFVSVVLSVGGILIVISLNIIYLCLLLIRMQEPVEDFKSLSLLASVKE